MKAFNLDFHLPMPSSGAAFRYFKKVTLTLRAILLQSCVSKAMETLMGEAVLQSQEARGAHGKRGLMSSRKVSILCSAHR